MLLLSATTELGACVEVTVGTPGQYGVYTYPHGETVRYFPEPRRTRPEFERYFVSVGWRRAVTSISIRILGSDNPAEIIMAAGRTSPKCLRRIGQHWGKSSRRGSTYLTRTTSRRLDPACARALWIFRKHCSVCSSNPSAMVMVW